jgi:protein O-GlcNAc transferase
LVYNRYRGCDWDDLYAGEAKLLDLVRSGSGSVAPFPLIATRASAADQLLCARKWARRFVVRANEMFLHQPRPESKRLRIGYLSADFHQHATVSLIAELLERHDRSRYDIRAYSYGPDDGSAARRRIAGAFEHFTDIRSLSHRDAAARIFADEIDVLIDLKGYTRHSRPAIMAFRPAPIQVSYLGYPATTGAEWIDYAIVDRFVVPPDQQAFFSEKLAYLPCCYQPNDTRREVAAVPSRAQCGLPNERFVFCSFNNSFKLTPAFFEIWMRLLAAVPGSVLWLLEANALAKRNLCATAQSLGIDPNRLVFAPIVSPAEHLARQTLADLFLDTLPCNAHTTASDALWAGLPVLTCVGETFAGRVAGSVLTAAGLRELITFSLGDYERVALELASNAELRRGLRERLQRERATNPLFDMRQRARDIEALYTQMWEMWRAGQPPASIALDHAPPASK